MKGSPRILIVHGSPTVAQRLAGVNSYMRKAVDFVQFTEAMRTLGLYWLVMNEPPPPG